MAIAVRYVEQRANLPAKRHEEDTVHLADEELLLLEGAGAGACAYVELIRSPHDCTAQASEGAPASPTKGKRVPHGRGPPIE
jgi:hypothetical protein